MSAGLLLALGALMVALVMLALWLFGIRNRNFSYVDIGWAANFALLAALYGACAEAELTHHRRVELPDAKAVHR